MTIYQISESSESYQVSGSSDSYNVTEAEPESIDDFITAMNAIMDPRITGNDSTFDGAGNWVTGLGGLLASDINSTIAGAMYLDFTTGNQAVKLENTVDVTNYFLVRIKAYKVSGAGMKVRAGAFSSGNPGPNEFDITPTSESRWFYGYLWGFVDTTFYTGAITANNNGTKIAIEEVHCEEVTVAEILGIDYDLLPTAYYSGLYDNILRNNQTLLNVSVIGNSIMANSYGGSIPNDEGDTLRPPRITTNNVPRRIYDKLKYNAPLFRRLDHADWTRSTLSGGDDFSELTNVADVPWAPNNTDEKYFRTVEAQAYCEIDIPDGYENCAFIYRKTYQFNSNNFDSSIVVTLNGGSIAAYGDASIDETAAVAILNESSKGYGLNLAVYEGLPAGVNTIRWTKANDTTDFHIWGVLYWSGNSMLLMNSAYGGADINALDEMTYQHTLINTFDLAFMEFPNMNNCSTPLTLNEQLAGLCRTINNPGYPIDNTLFYGTHPFGTDPDPPNTNYYTLYDDPDFKDSTELDMKIAGYFLLNYIDVFRFFESNIIYQGGTLVGGEAGDYYTSDGQHPDEEGADYYDTYLVNKLSQIPE